MIVLTAIDSITFFPLRCEINLAFQFNFMKFYCFKILKLQNETNFIIMTRNRTLYRWRAKLFKCVNFLYMNLSQI